MMMLLLKMRMTMMKSFHNVWALSLTAMFHFNNFREYILIVAIPVERKQKKPALA